VNVVLADDAVLFRQGLARLLAEAGFDVVGQAGDVDELLDLVERTSPDVAVVDIRMPPSHTTEGLEGAGRILAEHPTTGVVVLSQYVEADYALRLVRDQPGRVGYLLKERITDIDELTDAVTRVAKGGFVIDPSVVAGLLERAGRHDRLQDLSDRERDVLRLMAEGRSNQAIAERLFLTLRTVESHVRGIFVKLDLQPEPEDHRRVLAVLAHLRGSSERTEDRPSDPR